MPNVSIPTGLRDRAILETLYSTGLRRTELIRLAVGDLDPERGVVFVRQGKGHRDRVAPIGERALAWVKKYLADARPVLERACGRAGNDGSPTRCASIGGSRASPGTLFLTERGGPIPAKYLSRIVADYISRSGVGKSGSCHLFRHTLATLMLENGADVRHVQAMLGHACLQTTQLYTHVSIKALQAVHARTHPAANLAPRPKPDAGLAAGTALP